MFYKGGAFIIAFTYLGISRSCKNGSMLLMKNLTTVSVTARSVAGTKCKRSIFLCQYFDAMWAELPIATMFKDQKIDPFFDNFLLMLNKRNKTMTSAFQLMMSSSAS